MAKAKKSPGPAQRASLLAEIIKNARLTWRLLNDRRISPWLKMILPATLLYLISPIDFVPDPILGLGQLDDVGIILLGIKLFIELCPRKIVRQHLHDLTSITTSYRVIEEEKEEPPPLSIEAPYRVIDDKRSPTLQLRASNQDEPGERLSEEEEKDHDSPS